jgi:hypothetical protein
MRGQIKTVWPHLSRQSVMQSWDEWKMRKFTLFAPKGCCHAGLADGFAPKMC